MTKAAYLLLATFLMAGSLAFGLNNAGIADLNIGPPLEGLSGVMMQTLFAAGGGGYTAFAVSKKEPWFVRDGDLGDGT